jgi:hypothetical protein
MSAHQIDNLPNSGNDLTAIAQVAPGVQMSSASGGGYGNFTAFGLPATSNLFTVNGNDEMDPYLNLNASGATNLLLGKNEVEEAAVVSNGYTGQYGRQAGAQVDYATISGSNQFHGNANYWWNGVSMNANDWFQNETVPVTPKGFVNNNQYAARIGGPIKKDKAFFFVDYEGLRYILSTSQNAILPSANYLNSVIANLNVVDPAAVPLYTVIRDLNANAPGIARATPVSAALDPALGCGDLTLGQPGFTQFGSPSNGGGGVPCAVSLRSNVGQPSTEWILAGRADVNVSNVDGKTEMKLSPVRTFDLEQQDIADEVEQTELELAVMVVLFPRVELVLDLQLGSELSLQVVMAEPIGFKKVAFDKGVVVAENIGPRRRRVRAAFGRQRSGHFVSI